MKNLTAIYWIKNEAPYIPEYIEFHLLQGFDHFIFYDNGSTDDLDLIVEPYGDLVEIRKYPEGIIKKNFWLMTECIEEQKGKTKWLHFHAIDERVYSPTGLKLPEVLKEYDDDKIAGLAVGWQQIHSSGHIKKPTGLIIENYTKGQDIDPFLHIKTIIRPDRILPIEPPNPHTFYCDSQYEICDENKRKINGHTTTYGYSFDKIKNFHYATLSAEEFENKYSKGVLDHADSENKRRASFESDWRYYHDHGSKECTELLEFVIPVKNAINNRYRNNPELLQYINH